MLLLSARWPRPSGRWEISKWTKIWGILLEHALFAGGILEEDILIAQIEELTKLEASEIYPRRLNAREVLITQKENDAEDRENFGLFKDTSLIVIILNQEFNFRAERRIIPYFQDLYCWTNLLREEVKDAERRIGEKPNHLRQKKIQFYLILQGKDGTLYSFTALRPNSFRWKDLKKALHLIPSRHSVSVRPNSSSIPKTPGKYEILSSVNLGRKKYELRMWFWSANFGNRELRMVQKSLEICLREAMLIPD